jgi:2,4-dienoyl-CoA reductase-like NADH-dependent reductase (Old Yellow Enzyme family)
VRLSATDWAEGPEKDADGKWLQWGIEQTVLLAGELKKLGVDLIDVSSGGNWAAQKIPLVPGGQVRRPFPSIAEKANVYLLSHTHTHTLSLSLSLVVMLDDARAPDDPR